MPSKEPPLCQYEIFVVNNSDAPINYSISDGIWCRVNTNSFAKITADIFHVPKIKPSIKGRHIEAQVTCTDKVVILEVYNQ